MTTNDYPTEKLTQKQWDVLEVMIELETTDTEEIASYMEVSNYTIRDRKKLLKRKGWLIGSDLNVIAYKLSSGDEKRERWVL